MTAEFNVRDHLALPPEQAEFLTPQVEQEVSRIAAGFDRFVEGRGVEAPAALVQHDAYSDSDETARDELVRRLSLAYGVPLEAELNAFERSWDSHANGLVRVEPWMKAFLGVHEQPDEATDFNGVRRDADVTTQDGVVFGLHEVELPTNVDLGGLKRRASAGRIIYFSSRPA